MVSSSACSTIRWLLLDWRDAASGHRGRSRADSGEGETAWCCASSAVLRSRLTREDMERAAVRAVERASTGEVHSLVCSTMAATSATMRTSISSRLRPPVRVPRRYLIRVDVDLTVSLAIGALGLEPHEGGTA